VCLADREEYMARAHTTLRERPWRSDREEAPIQESQEPQLPDGQENTSDRVTRVTAFLPTTVWERVGRYAKAHRTTKTAALRRAISLLWFLHLRPGAQLICEYPDGRVERLFFLDDGDDETATSEPTRYRAHGSVSQQQVGAQELLDAPEREAGRGRVVRGRLRLDNS
jgi:hypothetical protein